jgi:glycosyltransferase involved in cell wall biosynthesis
MTNKPLVSVVMTVYNARRFVRGAVESILNQTYRNFELIIVDDGSTDGSTETIKELKRVYPRIKAYFLRRNHGPCYAANRGIENSKGTYLARMDADDIALPNRLEKQVEFLEKHPEVSMLGGQCILIDYDGKPLGKKTFPKDNKSILASLFARNPIQNPACMINLRRMNKNAILSDGKSILAHDLELVFLASRWGKLANLSDYVLEYRQYPTSFSLMNPKKTFLATLIVRLESILKYGYRPTLKGILTTLAQSVFVALFPNRLIFPIYAYLRGMRKINLKKVKIDLDAGLIFKKVNWLVRT